MAWPEWKQCDDHPDRSGMAGYQHRPAQSMEPRSQTIRYAAERGRKNLRFSRAANLCLSGLPCRILDTGDNRLLRPQTAYQPKEVIIEILPFPASGIRVAPLVHRLPQRRGMVPDDQGGKAQTFEHLERSLGRGRLAGLDPDSASSRYSGSDRDRRALALPPPAQEVLPGDLAGFLHGVGQDSSAVFFYWSLL